jgi:hypothetical protein
MTRPGDAPPGAAATALAVPGRWAERALCAQADPDAWFPDKGHCELTQLARRICARCPVRAQCLEYALSGADTWGHRDRNLGRHHTTRTRPAPATAQGGGMTSPARPRRPQQRARAARQALRLCETALPQGTGRTQAGRAASLRLRHGQHCGPPACRRTSRRRSAAGCA